MTARAMDNLRAHGLTPEKIKEISKEDLIELIKPVRFYSRKAQCVFLDIKLRI